MDRLSSCYFCGSALDESLTEYPVIPPSVDPDADGTVVLCQGCARKLDTIVERVVTAVERDDSATADTSPADNSEADAGTRRRDPPRLDDAPDLGPVGEHDSGQRRERDAEYDARSTESRGQRAGESRRGRSSTARRETEQTDRGQPESERPARAPEEAGGTEESLDREDQGETDGSAATEDEQSMTALEYNRVMRLVQNREFPIDRAEIETVAASAYELSRQDCARVIDAAIDRGLLAEDGGKLVAPE
ncbi:hypothetical protein VB773_12315 [Haloarculaceae archaeon H-GB2-1]|nr:hypothetical protein [Haloarculaceae archaeon H-GB1-1]MEA5386736.1 hypothetical protein [Haloarculaceae archaeon H-GB11]MEA5408263.1 hypothetical protein [Haloarculaceae archaeon H-GB2-1]